MILALCCLLQKHAFPFLVTFGIDSRNRKDSVYDCETLVIVPWHQEESLLILHAARIAPNSSAPAGPSRSQVWAAVPAFSLLPASISGTAASLAWTTRLTPPAPRAAPTCGVVGWRGCSVPVSLLGCAEPGAEMSDETGGWFWDCHMGAQQFHQVCCDLWLLHRPLCPGVSWLK